MAARLRGRARVRIRVMQPRVRARNRVRVRVGVRANLEAGGRTREEGLEQRVVVGLCTS